MSGEIGLYYERDTVIHRLDPRVKLAWFLLALAASIVTQYDGSVGVLVFLTLVAGLVLARLSLLRLLLTIVYSIVFFVVTVLVWASYYQNVGRELFYLSFANLRVTDVGLLVGTGKFFLIINPIIAMIIFFSTVKPYDLVQTFEKLRLPYKAGFALFLSLRLLPLTFREIKNIIDVQKSRGIEVDSRNPVKRVAYTIPVFIPLIIRIMSLTWETSITLMVRGFGASSKRTYVKPLKWTRRDTAALALLLLVYSSIIVLKLMGFSLYTYLQR
ncbi:MAG: energy-coupling factor transporter transmembrane protein EcfT [Desulfurococcaceae archaeon]|nr:energy-coupling factor transporter transmembrane protein EcfT [Desulfurococcaceae archaeon]